MIGKLWIASGFFYLVSLLLSGRIGYLKEFGYLMLFVFICCTVYFIVKGLRKLFGKIKEKAYENSGVKFKNIC